MKMVSWNMGCAWSGSPYRARHQEAWEYLSNEFPADLILVQEALVSEHLDSSFRVIQGIEGRYGSAIISRGFELVRRPFSDSDPVAQALAQHVVAADLRLPNGNVLVASVHARPYLVDNPEIAEAMMLAVKRKSSSSVWYSDLAFGHLVGIANPPSPFVFVGDWNEAREWDTVHGPEGGVEFFDRATAAGWFDGLRKFHETEQQTGLGQGHPYEDDHLFCDSKMLEALTSMTLVTKEPVPTFSDHAIILAEFNDSVVADG